MVGQLVVLCSGWSVGGWSVGGWSVGGLVSSRGITISEVQSSGQFELNVNIILKYVFKKNSLY